MATNCDKRLNEIIEKLEHEFKITDLGTPEKFLGMEIERTENGDMIKLHQSLLEKSLNDLICARQKQLTRRYQLT